MLSRKVMVNTLLVLASVLVFFIIGEVVVRYLQSIKQLPNYAKNQVTAEQKKINAMNPRLIPSDNPKLYVQFDPEDPRVNKAGMRWRLYSEKKPADTIRIAVIGDSVAFGFGLAPEESFPVMLENMLQQGSNKRIEVINFSVTGYGIEAYNEVYVTKARNYQPDIVLMTYILNDMTPPSDIFAIIRDVMKGGGQLKKVAKVSQFAAWLMVTWNEAKNSLRGDRSFTSLYEDPATLEKLKAHLDTLKNHVESDKAQLVVFVFPYFTELDDYPFKGIHAKVDKAIGDVGAEYHDLLDDFQQHDATAIQLQAGDITHPNAAGNRIAAQAMVRIISSKPWWQSRQ